MKKKTDFTDKPYSKCFACPHRLAQNCDGPRTAPMTLEKWCEYMRDMKEANGLTNAEVAERSGISVKRIEQLMALKCDQDIMRETARKIENAIVGSSNQYPCYLAFEEAGTDSIKQLTVALSELERMTAERAEAQKKVEHLLTQVEKLREQVGYLRIENDRKAKIIDKFLER